VIYRPGLIAEVASQESSRGKLLGRKLNPKSSMEKSGAKPQAKQRTDQSPLFFYQATNF
jgi:hypothetical protein